MRWDPFLLNGAAIGYPKIADTGRPVKANLDK
jgi:hypothetical protein